MSRRTLSPLIGALIFLFLYLAASPVAGAFSVGELPLPGSAPTEVHQYLAANTLPSLLTGLLQGLSGLGLVVVVIGPVIRACGPSATGLRLIGRVAGSVAVVGILTSAALSIVLSVIAPTASVDVVAVIQSVSFYAGGVVHVFALGVMTLCIAVTRSWSRTVRIVAWIAGILAVLSLLSTVIFYASLFLPVGRLTCMIALVVAGISFARGRTVVPAPASGTMVR